LRPLRAWRLRVKQACSSPASSQRKRFEVNFHQRDPARGVGTYGPCRLRRNSMLPQRSTCLTRPSVILIRKRKASLTAWESGKARATSSASWTVGAGAFRLGPRATTRSFRKSYSGRRSSSARRALDFLFIGNSFLVRCRPRANQANGLRPFGVRDHQETSPDGFSHKNKAVLLDRVIRV